MLGFQNQNNSCWFLSSMHVLLHVPQLANLFRNDLFEKMLFRKRKNACEFSEELSRLTHEYWKTSEYERTENVSKLIELFVKINRNFAGKKQYDATESFLALVSTLENSMIQKKTDADHPIPFDDDLFDMKQWNEYSEKNWKTFLSDLFLGQLKQTYMDPNTKKKSVTYEHFSALVLFPKKTLEQSIENYVSDGEITREFTRLPLVLPIIFQKSHEKEFVFYDSDLVVGDVKYDLFAILLHDGVDSDGHWYSMCKHNSTWNLLNDEKIIKIHDLNSLVHKNSMLLLYKRII